MQVQIENEIREQQLSELDRKVQALRKKAMFSKDAAEEGFERQIEAVEDKIKLFRAQLEMASKKSGTALKEMQGGLEGAWSALQSSFDSASTHIH